MTEALAEARAFRGWTLRGAQRHDEDFLFALHRDAMRAYVDATWGWDEEWQRAHFAANYAPERQAVIVHGGMVLCDVGRISLTRHWRKQSWRGYGHHQRGADAGAELRPLCRAARAALQSRATALRAARIPGDRRRRRAFEDAHALIHMLVSVRTSQAPIASISSMHTECSIR